MRVWRENLQEQKKKKRNNLYGNGSQILFIYVLLKCEDSLDKSTKGRVPYQK